MEKRKFPGVYVVLIVVAALCLCGFMAQNRGQEKSYVRLDGKYYYFGGCTVAPTALGEEIATVERRTPKSIFNRDGDSNVFEPGTKIYVPKPEIAAESGDIIYVEYKKIILYDDKTREEKIYYALFLTE